MTKYTISKENYKAAENYLLSFTPEGYAKYPTVKKIKESIESMLEAFDRSPDTSSVACGGLLLLCDEDDQVTIYVDPEYRYREVKNDFFTPTAPESKFELV